MSFASRVPWGLRGCLERMPHCRDAPWGVSEAATSPVLSQTPRGRAVALGIVLSAPETPHGASLHWGAQTESPLSRHPSKAIPTAQPILNLAPCSLGLPIRQRHPQETGKPNSDKRIASMG